MQNSLLWALCGFLLVGGVRAAADEDPFARARDVLQDAGLQLDEANLEDAAIEVFTRDIDAASRLLKPAEAARLRQEQSGRFYHPALVLNLSNRQVRTWAMLDGAALPSNFPPVGSQLVSISNEPVNLSSAAAAEQSLFTKEQAAIKLVFHLPPAEDVDAESGDDEAEEEAAETATNTLETFTVTNALLQLPSVAVYKAFDDNFFYLRLYGLFKADGEVFLDQFKDILAASPAGLVVDLRGAGGDDLKAVEVGAGLLHEKGKALFTLFSERSGVSSAFFGLAEKALAFPFVVLLDETTHGAAELFAGVLQAAVPGIFVAGQETAGDPLARDFMKLPEDRELYIRTRHFEAGGTTLDGRTGVKPDMEVEPVMDEAFAFEPNPDRMLSPKKDVVIGPGRKLHDWSKGDNVLTTGINIMLGLRALGLHEKQHADNP